ncbi:MAG: DMT family transporter [Devosia sp.]
MTSANQGLLLGGAGIALMCAMDAVAKALGAELSTFQIVFVRYVGAALWLALWTLLTGGSWPRLSDIGRQSLRGALLVITASMFFFAVAQLPLALVAALAMTAPLYVTLIGVILFREPMRPQAWIALGLGALGSAIIVFGGGALELGRMGGNWLAWSAAVLAPLSYAATLAVLKHHSGQENPAAMTLGQSAIAALLVLPLAWSAPPEITARAAGLATLIGLLGAIGFLLLINGLRRMSISAFAVIDYTGLLWAALLGFLFFGEIPGLQFWIGAALIITACSALTNQRGITSPPA